MSSKAQAAEGRDSVDLSVAEYLDSLYCSRCKIMALSSMLRGMLETGAAHCDDIVHGINCFFDDIETEIEEATTGLEAQLKNRSLTARAA